MPIFWLATSDHGSRRSESHLFFPARAALADVQDFQPRGCRAPVSDVRLGGEILPVVDEAASLLGDSEASQFLRESYRPGETMGSAFARLYARLFSTWGVILLMLQMRNFIRLLRPFIVVQSSGRTTWMPHC